MTRHKRRSFWAQVADTFNAGQSPAPKKASTDPQTPEAWYAMVRQMQRAARSVEDVRAISRELVAMLVSDPQNDWTMEPYLPRLLVQHPSVSVAVFNRQGRARSAGDALEESGEYVRNALAGYHPPRFTATDWGLISQTWQVEMASSQLDPEPWSPEPIPTPDGDLLLNDVEAFLDRFVAYPSEAARIAHTLWIGHAWFMGWWESTPRLAFLSTLPGSGKSRCLEVTAPLVPNPIHAVNVTPTYLFRKISDGDHLPTILFDEIDTVFNSKGGGNETLRGVLNAGYRRGATAGRCSASGVEELPAYCAVALAGLGHLPDTIMTRSVIINLEKRPENVTVESWRPRTVAPVADDLYRKLQTWSQDRVQALSWPDLPEGITDRNADIWEPLIAVADLAGGDWPKRAREAALYLINNR